MRRNRLLRLDLNRRAVGHGSPNLLDLFVRDRDAAVGPIELSVSSSENSLILSGKVTSYYFKQIAQEAVMAHRGDLRLDNQVDAGQQVGVVG